MALNRTKVEELNDFAIRSAYPSINFTTKKIESRKLFGRNEVEKNKDHRKVDEEMEKRKSGRKECSKEDRDKVRDKIKPKLYTPAASGIICIDCDEDDDSEVEVEVSGHEECADSFHAITERGRDRGGDDKRQRGIINNEEKKQEISNKQKDKKSSFFRSEMGGREEYGPDLGPGFGLDSYPHRFQVVLMEDPPHLLQRMYNADKGVRYTDNQNDRYCAVPTMLYCTVITVLYCTELYCTTTLYCTY